MSLRADNISLCYGDGDRLTYALREVTANFPERGFLGIMGPSGSGKSSLLYLLSGLKQPSSGEILYEGRSLTRMKEAERVQVRREKFGFVFQQPFLLNYLTALENVLVAAPKEDKEAVQRVDSLLDELNILP
ncbi:MAG: ABC-type antimicrobial peptide transport system,ATPase component, partial [Chthonomonadaceae bacterium]|nr:ABC-type antimicrobial peptide transport system,ATPase component [Chthonomonadaceae bacterium]